MKSRRASKSGCTSRMPPTLDRRTSPFLAAHVAEFWGAHDLARICPPLTIALQQFLHRHVVVGSGGHAIDFAGGMLTQSCGLRRLRWPGDEPCPMRATGPGALGRTPSSSLPSVAAHPSLQNFREGRSRRRRVGACSTWNLSSLDGVCLSPHWARAGKPTRSTDRSRLILGALLVRTSATMALLVRADRQPVFQAAKQSSRPGARRRKLRLLALRRTLASSPARWRLLGCDLGWLPPRLGRTLQRPRALFLRPYTSFIEPLIEWLTLAFNLRTAPSGHRPEVALFMRRVSSTEIASYTTIPRSSPAPPDRWTCGAYSVTPANRRTRMYPMYFYNTTARIDRRRQVTSLAIQSTSITPLVPHAPAVQLDPGVLLPLTALLPATRPLRALLGVVLPLLAGALFRNLSLNLL